MSARADDLGLYIEKDRRVYASAFQRSKSLTPLHEILVPKLDQFPHVVRSHILAEYERRAPLQWQGETQQHARDWLVQIVAKLSRRKLDVAFDVDETATLADRLAALSRREGSIENIKRFASYLGLDTPKGNKNSTPESLARRCFEPKTWRRIIERNHTRSAETCLREMGYVERRANLYCSGQALEWFHGKQRAQTRWLKSHRVVAADGEQLKLWDVQQASVSNPAIRRAELMTRMKGFEDIAKEMGHVAEFITLTAPSKFHSMLSSGGANPQFTRDSPRDAQAWLQKMWARSRAKFKRLSLIVYGFRIVEPHHDGTPHWHMVLFTMAHSVDALRTVLRSHWLSEYGDERGAASHRIEFKAIDPAQGSATGYISKYVAKNIDGHEVGEDFEANTESADGLGTGLGERSDPLEAQKRSDASRTAARVRAWASLHGFRQFQQIGGPGITLYRECRRCRDPIDLAVIEAPRMQADMGNFAGYIRALGGIGERNGPLSLWTKVTGQTNQFDEPRRPQIKGIRCGLFKVATHVRTWSIERVEVKGPDAVQAAFSELRSDLGPVSITVREPLTTTWAIFEREGIPTTSPPCECAECRGLIEPTTRYGPSRRRH